MTTTTLRLPDEMAQAVKSTASAKGMSVNDLVRSAIGAYLKAQEEKELYDAFTRLGANPEEANVEHTFHAAAEVVNRNG